MKRWDDVRSCAACGGEVVWDDEDARWLHVLSGADHIAVAPPTHVVRSEVLVDVDAVSSLLQAEGGNVPRATTAVVQELTHESTPRLCPGQCGARWRSAVRRAVEAVADAERTDRAVDPVALQGRAFPNAGEPVWCADDAAAIVKALGRLPDLVAAVNVRGDGRLNAGRDGEVDVRSTEVHAPSPSPAHDLFDAAVRWAAAEAARVAEAVTGGRGADNDPLAALSEQWLTRAVAYLVEHADVWLGDLVDGETAGRATLRWETDLERATGLDLVHRLPGRCPGCSTRALTRAVGDDVVRCGRCGWSKTHADYLLGRAETEAAQRAEARRQRLEARRGRTA
ncbi:hypothetical protein WDZ16_13010 [Pseudokineococcus marinus]|uniref:Uncharacterized protein n=1 Tax=Pseudokineococcus marinus TaxID=351215 RepID=A0A849BJX2_9ACTN|nr:hypothetical protein [Pseudokineococcus marinus]NNH21655.1 hypothetical protein [Pseudokineococcus marinus]